MKINRHLVPCLVAGSVLAIIGLSASAQTSTAADNAPNSDSPTVHKSPTEKKPVKVKPEEKIFGSFGVDYASHFVSYGSDVYGAGNSFYGSKSVTFAHINLGAKLPNGFTARFGVWSDINDNTKADLGGNIQEVDVYGGLAYTVDTVTLGAIYQQWNYAGNTEKILDISAALDDSTWWGNGFALNPSFLTHIRVDGQPGQDDGATFVGSVKPAFPLLHSKTWPITLLIPTSVGFLTDNFQGGEGGFGYTSIGATAKVGLGVVPVGYGNWSLAFNTTYYHTRHAAFPNNPEEDFVAGMASFNIAF